MLSFLFSFGVILQLFLEREGEETKRKREREKGRKRKMEQQIRFSEGEKEVPDRKVCNVFNSPFVSFLNLSQNFYKKKRGK